MPLRFINRGERISCGDFACLQRPADADDAQPALYAVTRAKQLVVLVGLRETVSAMICNDREIDRYTGIGTADSEFVRFYAWGDIV